MNHANTHSNSNNHAHADAHAVGIFEIGSWTASIVALDAAEKTADIRLLQIELNDMMGASVKVTGPLAAVTAAIATAEATARAMHASVISSILPKPARGTTALWPLNIEYNPLIEQNVIYKTGELIMAESNSNQAIGLIETQGFTAVIEAIDTACKAANVEVAGREKLGGGYICVVIRGDVAAVKAAVEAGRTKVEGLGKLIAAHVIARPSASVQSLLPK